ncbi:hypothetical protein M433DRAFT_251709 [Acidomyces richmondensis BFW]|nr:hypothetical protein M433DRAFT_251709 [Acidomyces richmondensis BFW]
MRESLSRPTQLHSFQIFTPQRLATLDARLKQSIYRAEWKRLCRCRVLMRSLQNYEDAIILSEVFSASSSTATKQIQDRLELPSPLAYGQFFLLHQNLLDDLDIKHLRTSALERRSRAALDTVVRIMDVAHHHTKNDRGYNDLPGSGDYKVQVAIQYTQKRMSCNSEPISGPGLTALLALREAPYRRWRFMRSLPSQSTTHCWEASQRQE